MGELRELVEFMLKEPLDYDVSLHIAKEQIRPLELASEESAYLGVNSVIGSPQQDLEVIFVN